MKAVVWEGPRHIAVADVPEPKIEEPTDAIIKVTSSGICGSDLHLYEALGPFLTPGDVLGHEPMGEVVEVGQEVTLLPDGLTEKLMRTAGIDQLAALTTAIDLVRRGGTLSVSGVYGGMAAPLPMLTMFDKQLTLRLGQATVRRWVEDIMPLVTDDTDPLGLESFATHHLLLDEAPQAYKDVASKDDGMVKVLLRP